MEKKDIDCYLAHKKKMKLMLIPMLIAAALMALIMLKSTLQISEGRIDALSMALFTLLFWVLSFFIAYAYKLHAIIGRQISNDPQALQRVSANDSL